jgi:O-antigen/teichoic acid export membrane protein
LKLRKRYPRYADLLASEPSNGSKESMTDWQQDRGAIAQAWRKLIPWASKSGFAIADQGFISGSNFLLSILLARWMRADQYGAYALAFSIFVLLSLVYLCVVLEPMAVFGGSVYRNGLRQYLKSLLWIHLLLSLGIFLVLGLSSGAAAVLGSAGGLPGALLGVTLASPCVLLFWLARRSFYLELSPASAALGAGLYVLVVLGGLYLIRWSGWLSPFTAFLPISVGALLTCALLFYRLQPALRSSHVTVRTGEVWRRHWGYGRWALASAVASWIPAYIYYPLLTSFSGMAHSGEFKALMNLVLPMQQMQAALSMLFLPYAARVYAEQGREGAISISARLTLLSLASAVVYWVAIISAKEKVFHLLYSGKYMEVAYLVPAIAIGSLLWSAVCGSAIVLRAMASPRSVFVAFVASSVVSLAIGIPATRAYGIVGSVWGTNLADAGALLMVLWLLRRKIASRPELVGVEG